MSDPIVELIDAAAPAAASEATETPAVAEVLPPDDPFSEAALASKEGVAAAREALVKERREWARQRDAENIRLAQRRKEAQRREDRLRIAREQKKADDTMRDAALAKLFNGSGNDVLQALGQLTRRDGLKVYEQISLAVAGKRPITETPEVQELRTEIQRIKDERKQELTKQQAEQESSFVRKRTQDLVNLAQANPRAKLLLDRSPKYGSDLLVQYKREAYEAGRPITDAQAVAKLVEHLDEIAGVQPAGGQETASNKPGPGKQKVLTAAKIAASASSRPLSDDEIIEAAVQDKDFLTALGLQ